MTYTFTYTILTHSHLNYNGQDVITNITYTINASRSDGKSASWNSSLGFPLDSVDKVIPRSRAKYDASDNVITESAYSSRSDFTSYNSLTIPDDLVAWVKAHHENDALELQGIKNMTDTRIGA